MGLFRKKSTWQKLIEPVSNGVPKAAAKPGLAALGTFVAMSLASAVVSSVRQRQENR
jgi:hypothetical protein